MADITIRTPKVFSGLDADKANAPGAVGDTYAATDTGEKYFWDVIGAAWAKSSQRTTTEIVGMSQPVRLDNINLGAAQPGEIQALPWIYTGPAVGVNSADGVKVTLSGPANCCVSLTRDIGNQQKAFALFGWYIDPAGPGNPNFYAQTRFIDTGTGNEWIIRNNSNLDIYSSPPLTLRASLVGGLFLVGSVVPVGGIINITDNEIAAWWSQSFRATLPSSLAALPLADVDRVIFEVHNNTGAAKVVYLKPPLTISYE